MRLPLPLALKRGADVGVVPSWGDDSHAARRRLCAQTLASHIRSDRSLRRMHELRGQ